MSKRDKPPSREWEVDDLLDLGRREGDKALYLKAVPVLILENWLRGGRKEDSIANYARTKQLARRIVECGLHPPFKPKGTSNILGAMGAIQRSRNLTRPQLMDWQKPGESKVNLPYYEDMLEEYRQIYCEQYPEDYKKLFPEGEPEWELPEGQPKRKEVEQMPAKSEVQEDIQSLLAPIEQFLRDQQQDIRKLTEEKQKLQKTLESGAKDAPVVLFVHTSPDFHRSDYGGKVISIKETIEAMLKRAKHSVRISTRQMDMFVDELIDLKRHNPDIEITVLSRGTPTVGDRKAIAGRAWGLMKQAGIKLPVEKETLHSRLVVIDAKEVLVSSADLDFTQLEKEFNAGIWTNNPDVVAKAIRYFDNLVGFSQIN